MVAANDDMVTFNGRTDVGHIPYQPFWLLIIRGVQLLLAILVLALSAYAGSGYIFSPVYGIGIFTPLWTLLFLCYIEISTFWYPVAYNKYVHLVLECLCVIWWLTAFSWLASWAAVEDWAWSDNCIDGICYKVKARSYNYTGEANATKAGAALGAINWILFCGTLITYGIYLHRHRRGVMEARQMGVTGNAVHEEHKMGPVVTQQPVYVQPTGYAQPTGYNQVPVDPRYQQVNMA